MAKEQKKWSTDTVRVETHDGFAGVYAPRKYAPGDHLLPLRGRVGPNKSRYSIQVGIERHLDPEGRLNGRTSAPAPWKYLNHSCDPNLQIDLDASCFTALRGIESGEELTFNYLTTEWEMASPFRCLCRTASCHEMIQGFKFLSPEEQEQLLDSVAPHIRTLVERSRRGRRNASGWAAPGVTDKLRSER